MPNVLLKDALAPKPVIITVNYLAQVPQVVVAAGINEYNGDPIDMTAITVGFLIDANQGRIGKQTNPINIASLAGYTPANAASYFLSVDNSVVGQLTFILGVSFLQNILGGPQNNGGTVMCSINGADSAGGNSLPLVLMNVNMNPGPGLFVN